MTSEQQSTMFSSASAEWMTPRWLFDLLNAQFHFDLDVASTVENALCSRHFTRETDALARRWVLARDPDGICGCQCHALEPKELPPPSDLVLELARARGNEPKPPEQCPKCPDCVLSKASFFCNPPYGPAITPCKPYCYRQRCADRGAHVTEYQAGCLDFVIRGIEQVKKYGGTGVYLVPARTDTEWFRRLWRAAASVLFIAGRIQFERMWKGRRILTDPAPFPSVVVEIVSDPPEHPVVRLWDPPGPDRKIVEGSPLV